MSMQTALDLESKKSVQRSVSGNAEMVVVDIVQKSDAWLEWRSQGITATDIPVILGYSPYKTPYQLWAEKTGRFNTPDISANPNVKRGVRLEDVARQVAEQRYGGILMPVCGEFVDWPILRASLDGQDPEFIPYEFKAPSDAQWNDIKENGHLSAAYIMYACQVRAQCIVSGVNHGKLLFYRETDSGPEDMEFDIELTVEEREQILSAARVFHRLVETETPPDKDPERDMFEPEGKDASFKWSTNAETWRTNNTRIKSLKDQLEILEKDQKAVQKNLLAQMGPFMQADIAGVKVSRFEKQGAIDYKKFLQDKFPGEDLSQELEAYRKASQQQSRFTRSEDELINRVADEVITGKSAYF